jgi:hypothetical protein
VRVYLAATLPALADALRRGTLESPVAYAVTPALREWYTDGDLEELEHAAADAAARAALRRLGGADVPARRVVLAADVADAAAHPASDLDRAAVRLGEPVAMTQVVAALVDDPGASADVRRAALAVAAAEAGDEDAAFVVDSVEGHQLGWYAAQELPMLVELEA